VDNNVEEMALLFFYTPENRIFIGLIKK